MRNLNAFIPFLLVLSSKSFILTMRNLNYYMVYAMGEDGQSFILTMRNLNRVINDICEKFQVVLY